MFSQKISRIALSATLAVGVGLGGSLVAAGAAQAAKVSQATFIATPNGIAGVTQEVVVSAPKLKGQVVSIGFQNNGTTGTLQTTIGSNGYGYMNWLPSAAGTWTISGLGTATSLGSTNITISPLSTATTLLAPNFAQAGQNAPLTAIVTAPVGTVSPQGTVTVYNQNLNVIASGALVPNAGTGSSSVTMNWTPQMNVGSTLSATFVPSNNTVTGSSSPQTTVGLQEGVVPVAMRISQSIHVGQPVLLSAVLGYNMPEGSAAFISNLGGLSPSIPTVNGVSNWLWTPNVAGVQYLRVDYSSTVRNTSGSSQQSVNVLPALPQDSISMSAAGFGTITGASPLSMTVGQSIALTGTTTSGAPVLLSEQGPCAIAGSNIIALGAGQCVVTAMTPGTAAYTTDTNTYVVGVQNPPKKRR